jgi:ferric-dicitrate binding protein FerR (iron transport regulator)
LGLKKRPVIFRLLPSGSAKRRGTILVPVLLVILAGVYFINRFLIHTERVIERINNSNDPIVFSLADGTTVTLAPRAVLSYASGFGDKERTVSLNGEALFDVTRKTDHPFEVKESEIKVTVLGTTFSVKKQPGDSVMVVELIKGKLKVENINERGQALGSIVLNPDERVIYKRHDHQLYKESWQPQAEFPIQIDHILFQRNNFDAIAAKIKAAIGITVVNQSKKKNWMFSGEFENATAEEIIKNICVVERLKFETTGDTILIK